LESNVEKGENWERSPRNVWDSKDRTMGGGPCSKWENNAGSPFQKKKREVTKNLMLKVEPEQAGGSRGRGEGHLMTGNC